MRGFAVILVILMILVFVTGGAVFLQIKSSKSSDNNPSVSESYPIKNQKEYGEHERSSLNSQKTNPYLGTPCESNPKVQFTNDFTEVGKIRIVEPTIITAGNSRHRAWLDIDTSKAAKVAVYAPVDSELVGGVYKSTRGETDYDLHFQVSCEIWYLINHVQKPVDKIKNAFPEKPQLDTRDGPRLTSPIKVKSGELIGYTAGTANARNFDFGVFDLNHVNKGLPSDGGSQYGKEKNFICPFDVLPENIRKSYYEKILPSEKPFSNCEAH